jgi:UDP-N-acetylglucosamine 4,6-dehydratase
VARAKRESWPCTFTILSRDEVKQSQMRAQYPDCRYVLGSVTDLDLLTTRMRGHDVVIHAAAYKQVPAAEVNSREAMLVNVVGSSNVAAAATRVGVHTVVGVSTDKAVAPVNAYGATKMVMEKIFQEANCWSDTAFRLCRYGNVLGSRGSVVPFFRALRDSGRPLTITDRRMTRFWMTMDQAVDLVLKAYLHPSRGVIVVPVAPASPVYDLAQAVIRERQMVTSSTIADIGIRPGEKIHECLIHRGESLHAYKPDVYGDCFVIYPSTHKEAGDLPDQFEYTSDQPEHVLTVDDLVELLRHV